MHNIPPVELAIRISKILNRNKNQLKEYQDRNGRINFNLLIGLVLGGICSFTDKPAINQILRIFFPIFNDSQLEDYANLMMGLNNHLVYLLDTNPGNIYLLENNKWVLITEAEFDSVYALWYAFFGIMKVEFAQEKDRINKLKSNHVTSEALADYNAMYNIMTSSALSIDDISTMQDKFPEYAYKFNELRKLMYMQAITPQSTLH